MLIFLRRRKLGKNSVQGMRNFLGDIGTSQITTGFRRPRVDWSENTPPENSSITTFLVRWGNIASITSLVQEQRIGLTNDVRVFNKAESIKLVNDKARFRKVLSESDANRFIPSTWISLDGESIQQLMCYPLILRPRKHAQGRKLWVVHNFDQLQNLLRSKRPYLREGYYLSELIDKTAEYRVYFMKGRVISVAEKIPDDPSRVAWNVAQGSQFNVVRFDDWPLEAIRASYECFKHSGLDFGGVDVIVSEDDTPYVIEINSAPSLPFLSDGSISYRQQSMAKGFKYHYQQLGDIEEMEPVGYDNWRDVIHPAINHNARLENAVS